MNTQKFLPFVTSKATSCQLRSVCLHEIRRGVNDFNQAAVGRKHEIFYSGPNHCGEAVIWIERWRDYQPPLLVLRVPFILIGSSFEVGIQVLRGLLVRLRRRVRRD